MIRVNSPNVQYSEEFINSQYNLHSCEISNEDRQNRNVRATNRQSVDDEIIVTPNTRKIRFRTQRAVPRCGLMMVGLGGNNATTVAASIVANREGIEWNTRLGPQKANYFGSITQASTVFLGYRDGQEVNVPLKSLLPMVEPNDLIFGGWDINNMNMADALDRAEVYDYDLRQRLRPHLEGMVPLPSVYFPDFIASNQGERANNVIPGDNKRELLEHLRRDMRTFKEENNLDRLVVLWTANTERYAEIIEGINDTAENLMAAIDANHPEVSPSTLFAIASILEGHPYINGSPQNSFVPGVFELALRHHVHIAGDDFKSGQTKMKSVLAEFLVTAGIKPLSIVSYNHLGNNDGFNLSSPQQFRSKEISKASVVDDIVASNEILYPIDPETGKQKKPDHVIVIKYVPTVGDSKRAMDEYTSEIFMGGRNTIVMHNTCEDSLLAAPLIIDLAILAELMTRITYAEEDATEFKQFHPVLAMLGYLLKAPQFPSHAPVVNGLNRQRQCLESIMRACIGLPCNSNFLNLI